MENNTTTTPTIETQLLDMLKRYVDTFDIQDDEQLELNAEAMELIEKVDDMDECIGCSYRFDFEVMATDGVENYCPECWAHFKRILEAEYQEMKAKGEID